MDPSSALLATVLLGDGRLPVGASSHSWGVEVAVRHTGLTTAADLEAFLRERLAGAGWEDREMLYRAALMFVQGLERDGQLDATAHVKVELYGSLGATGKGHGTDRGVMLGLLGDAPDTVDPDTIDARLEDVRKSKQLALLGTHPVPFVLKENIAFYRQALPEHPNARYSVPAVDGYDAPPAADPRTRWPIS